MDPTNTLIKFVDDTCVAGYLTWHIDEVQKLSVWSSANNLKLNTSKTKEMIKSKAQPSTKATDYGFKFLKTHTAEALRGLPRQQKW